MSNAKQKVSYLDLDVDELGRLLAEKAELDTRIKMLKDNLATLGAGVYEGKLFRASVSVSERTTVDYKAIVEKLGASSQMIRGNSRVSETVTVRCTARKGV